MSKIGGGMNMSKECWEEIKKEQGEYARVELEREKTARAQVALYDFMNACPENRRAVQRMISREAISACAYGWRDAMKFRDEEEAKASKKRGA